MIKGWDCLLEFAEQWEVVLEKNQLEQFRLYLSLLQEWNKNINLTAIVDDEAIVIKHFIDSLLFLKKIEIGKQAKVLDLGTGAGLPGIPLKIWRPELEIVLVDSLQKRINFLHQLVTHLGLKKIDLVHGRAEDLAKQENFREQFDFVVSRAVASLNVLTEYSLPFVKIGGCFAAAKGPDLEKELKEAERAIEILGGAVKDQEYYLLPFLNEQRSFVKIVKLDHTPAKYPRKAGIPAKKPL